MGDLFDRPATRRTDPATSHKAADRQAGAVPTIRAMVLAHAMRAGASGFIDDELVRPDRPESSIRKRRSELAQENWLIATGPTRQNRWGNAETVWVHRDFVPQAPALKERMAPQERDNLHARADARASDLESWARQMQAEGRSMFAEGLRDCAALMRSLAA